jgi:membrane associated rhomboid family serine protease
VHPEHFFLPVVGALVLIGLTALLITLNWRAANGRLRRNQPLHLLTLAATLLWLVFSAMYAQTVLGVQFAWLGSMFGFVVVVLYTALVASRAARSGDDPPLNS